MGYETRPSQLPGGSDRDTNDHARLRHARDRHLGFPVGRYGQPAPMLFTRDGHNLFLGDMYRGRAAFLICSGPSLVSHDLALLNDRGFLTMAVNNAATVVRPTLWTSVDDPGNFSEVIWQDPGIMKFVPLCHMEKHFQIRDADDLLVPSAERVGDMPAVFGYRRNERFVAEQWLYEDTFNWGNRGGFVDADGNQGSRSVMYVALRMLFYLGVRTVYLLGCDFKMEVGKQNYAFPQERSAASVRGNNSSYRILNERLRKLIPYFAAEGFEVFNCTPQSGLTAFSYLPYEDAVREARAQVARRINTAGMYDRAQVRTPAGNRARRSMKQAAAAKRAEFDPIAATAGLFDVPANGLASAKLKAKEPHDDLPKLDVTLVTRFDESAQQEFHRAYASWRLPKGGLENARRLIVCDPHLNRDELLAQLDRGSPVKCTTCCAKCGSGTEPEHRCWGWMQAAAKHAETEWTLYLSPRVKAVDDEAWYDPRRLQPDDRDVPPVLLGNFAPLSTYPELVEAWRRWSLSIPAFATLKRLPVLPRNRDACRGRRLVPWYVLVKTAWLRRLIDDCGDGRPPRIDERFLHYLAVRQGETVATVDPVPCGWRLSE